MGIRFNENASNYLQITDSSVLSLPNGSWCICFWESTSDNTGTQSQYVVSSGISGSNEINILFVEDSASSDQGKLVANVQNAVGASYFGANYTAALTFDGTPRLWVIQRVANTNAQIIRCEAYSSPTTEVDVSLPTQNSVNPSELEIGRRADGNTLRPYGGDIGHYFHGDFNLSLDEIRFLASGGTIFELGKTPNFYLPLLSNVANPPDLVGGLTTTRNGTLANGVAFPPDIRGFMNAMVFTPAAVGGFSPYWAAGSNVIMNNGSP